MSNKEKLRYLLAMAMADGGVKIEELRLLGDRAILWGTTDDEFEALLEEAARGVSTFEMPRDVPQRHELIKELVRMMAADGVLHPHERRMFAAIAAQMEVDRGAAR